MCKTSRALPRRRREGRNIVGIGADVACPGGAITCDHLSHPDQAGLLGRSVDCRGRCREPKQVLLNGKAPGGVLHHLGRIGQSQAFEVSVDIDVMGLTQKIHEVFPSEPVQISTSGPVVMLSGKVSSPEVAEKILDVVKNVAPKVTSLMEVPATPTEDSLQVKFAEVSRQAISQFGVNLIRTFGSNMPMSTSTQQFRLPRLESDHHLNDRDHHHHFYFRAEYFKSATCSISSFTARTSTWRRPSRRCKAQNLLQILAEPI